MTRPAGLPRLGFAAALLAVAAPVLGWAGADRLQPRPFDATTDGLSALFAEGRPTAWMLTTALLVCAGALAAAAVALVDRGRLARAVLLGAAVATAGFALTPLDLDLSPSVAHVGFGCAAMLLLALWPWVSTGGHLLRGYAAGSALVVVLLALVLLGRVDLPAGVVERAATSWLLLGPMVVAGRDWWRAGHRVGTRPVRRLLAFGLTATACALAGVSATAIAPVRAETRHYAAQVSLDPNPFSSSSLVATTVFGDVDVPFRGLAPGIRATPQVKASITDLLGRPNISVSSLAPGPLELDTAVRGAAWGLALRFALGAAAVVLVVVLLAFWRRGRRADWGVAGRTVAAMLVALAVTGASTAGTYRVDHAQGFATTGLLSTVQANSGLFADVEARSKEVAPYLTNLVALTGALQQRYTPAGPDADVALRLLLVSDLHVGNQYPLLKDLVAAEDVDAVVDSGDLLTFGTVEEGEAAGLFDGIASLGVPYLFVRGNHDATSATDRALLDRMARIPNVVLLQPGPAEFTDVTLHGVRISGVNDTRWFGDDGKRTADAQRPAIAAYQEAFADRPEPDLFVTHHPLGAREVTARVTVNGHMHAPLLEGHRIQVGTFTGGGPFTHYVHTEDGSELAGQPSAFDLLTFGTDCRVAGLTRFTFRNLIEGRPAYDQVAIVNGRRIDGAPAERGRTCGATEPLERAAVSVP